MCDLSGCEVGSSMSHKCCAVDCARKVWNRRTYFIIHCSTQCAIGGLYSNTPSKVGVAFLLIFCPFAVIMLHRCLCVFNGHVGETLEDLLSNGTNLTAIFEHWMEVSPDPFDSIGALHQQKQLVGFRVNSTTRTMIRFRIDIIFAMLCIMKYCYP